jgi:ribonuclease HII
MALIAGVDEAGRGPLAGPVVAAAVILPKEHSITGLRDSKQLTPKQRATLYEEIHAQAMSIGVGVVDSQTIDRVRIQKATQIAMQMALGRLQVKPDRALIDGAPLANQIIPNEGIIRGDQKIDSIMAASIIAKVTRDRMMMEYDTIFPEYGFAKHKGYGTVAHREALERWKATPIHRKTFNPVPQYLPTLSWYRQQRRIGWLGERLAALRLLREGFSIVEMNVVSHPYGEIDIIAEDGNELVFIEVKTISREQIGSPELKIDHRKLAHLEQAIQHYLTKHDLEQDIRLDVMTISIKKGKVHYRHYRGVELDIL